MGTSNKKAMSKALRGLPSKFSRGPDGAASGYFDKDPALRHRRRQMLSEVGPSGSELSPPSKKSGKSRRPAKIRKAALDRSHLGHDSVPFLDRETHLPVETRVAGQLSNTAEAMRAMSEVTRELTGVSPGPQVPQEKNLSEQVQLAPESAEVKVPAKPEKRAKSKAKTKTKTKTKSRTKAKSAKAAGSKKAKSKAGAGAKKKAKTKPKTKPKAKVKATAKVKSKKAK